MSKTRAIRLSEDEYAQIEEFLTKNPFFDFSTLARTAIIGFIKDPRLVIKPIDLSIPKLNSTKGKGPRDVRN